MLRYLLPSNTSRSSTVIFSICKPFHEPVDKYPSRWLQQPISNAILPYNLFTRPQKNTQGTPDLGLPDRPHFPSTEPTSFFDAAIGFVAKHT